MHDCKRLQDEIWERVEAGEKPDDLIVRIGNCQACRNELARAESAIKEFQAFHALNAPDCTSAVMTKIDISNRGRTVWVYVFGVAVIFAVVAALTFINRPGEKHSVRDIVKNSIRRSVKPDKVTRKPVARERMVAAGDKAISSNEKEHPPTHRVHRDNRTRQVSSTTGMPRKIIHKKPHTTSVVGPPVMEVDPVVPLEQDRPKIEIIVMDDTINQTGESNEAVDYGYTQTNTTTGDVTQCSVKRSGRSVEIYMKMEPGNKPIPGEGKLEHKDENNV